jgi:hypothetical protein
MYPHYFTFSAHEKKDGPVKLREKLQKNERKSIYKIHTLFYILG